MRSSPSKPNPDYGAGLQLKPLDREIHIHRHEGEAGVRRILGVLALARKHGPAVVEDAAKAPLDLGVPTYRFLRR